MDPSHEKPGSDPSKRMKTGEETEQEVKIQEEKVKDFGGLECDLTNTLMLSYVSSEADLDNLDGLKEYPATYPENIFQSEKLKGLKNPKLRVFFSPLTLKVFAKFSSEKQAACHDDPLAKLKTHYSEPAEEAEGEDEEFHTLPCYTEDLETFKIWVREELAQSNLAELSFKHITSFEGKNGASFEIQQFSREDQNCSELFDTSLQLYNFFHIDDASVIEDDPAWRYFLLFEIVEGKKKLAGFSTVYKNFHAIDKVRTRISQFLVLPLYQGQGLGQKFLQHLFSYYFEKEECFQITMESPTDTMGKMYHMEIAARLLQTGCLDPLLNKAKTEFKTVTKESLDSLLIKNRQKAMELAKLAKTEVIQVTNVYYFILGQLLDKKDEEAFLQFGQFIKNRYHKQFMLDFNPNKRFEVLQQSQARVKRPYLVFKDEEGELSTQKVEIEKQNPATEQQTNAMRLEMFFIEFMKQADMMKNLASLLA